MLRNTLLNLKKACIATLPRIWRGHIVKCNARFQKVPCLCSSSAKNSKSPKDVAKCKRIIDYIFNNGDFPTGDIKGLPNKELAQFIALKGKLGHPKANKHVLRANRRSMRTNAGAVTTGTRDRQHSLSATASEGAPTLEQKIQKLREIAPVEADKVEKYLSRFHDSTNYEAKRQVAITFIDDTTRIELLKDLNKDIFSSKAYLEDPPLVESGAEVVSEPRTLAHSIKAAQPNFTTKKEEEHLAQKIEKIEDPPLVEAGETAEVLSEPKILSHGVINKPAIFTLPNSNEPNFIFKFRKDPKAFAIPAQKATDKVPLSFVKADKDAKEAENLKKLAAFTAPDKKNEEIVQKIEQLLKEPSINIKVTEPEIQVKAETQYKVDKPLWMNINRVEVDNVPTYAIAAKPLFRDKPPKIDEDLFKRNIDIGMSAAESKVTKKYSRFGRHERPCTPMFNAPKHITETEQRIAQSSHLTPLLLTSGSDPLKRGSDIGGSSSVSPSSTTEPVQNPRSLEEELKNWEDSQTIKHEEEGDEGDYFKALEKPDGKPPLLQFKQIKHKIKQAIVSKTAPFMETPVVSMHTGAGERNTSSSKQDQNPIQNIQSPAIDAIPTQGANLIRDTVLQNQSWAGQRKSESQYFLPLTNNWVSASQNSTLASKSHKYFLPLSHQPPSVNTSTPQNAYLTPKLPLDPPQTAVPASFPSKDLPTAIQEPQTESKVILMGMKSDRVSGFDPLVTTGGVRSFKTDSADSTWKSIQDKFKENTFGFNVLKQLSKPLVTKTEPQAEAKIEAKIEPAEITQPAEKAPLEQPATAEPATTEPVQKSNKWKFFNIMRTSGPEKDMRCNSKDGRPVMAATGVHTGKLQIEHEDLYADQLAGFQTGAQPAVEMEADRPLAKIAEESEGEVTPAFLRDTTPLENQGLESMRQKLISRVKAEDRPFSRIERHSAGSSGGDPPSLLKSIKLDTQQQDVIAAGYESDPNFKFEADAELQPVIQDDDDDELNKTRETAKSNFPTVAAMPNFQNNELTQLLQMYKIKQDVDKQQEYMKGIENPSFDDFSECMVLVPAAENAIATKPALPATKPKRPKYCPVQAKRRRRCKKRRRRRRKCKRRRKRRKCRRRRKRKCRRRKRKCKKRRRKKRKCRRKKRKCRRKKRRGKKCRRKRRKCRRKKRKCRRKKRKCRRKKRKCRRKKRRKCKRAKRRCVRAKPKCKPKAKPKCKCVDVGANLPFDITKPTLFMDVLPENRMAIEGESSRDARLDTSDLPMMPAAKTNGLGLIWDHLVRIRGLEVNKQDIVKKDIVSPTPNVSSASSRFYNSLNSLLNYVTFGNFGKGENLSLGEMIDTRVV